MLIHQANCDSCLDGLFDQRPQEMGPAPLPQPQVLHPTDVTFLNASEVANQQGADLQFDHEVDDVLGRLVVRLVDAAEVTGLDQALPGAVAAPATRSPVSRLWGSPRSLGAPSLLVAQMKIALSADRSTGDQQASVLGHRRIRMNDAEIHTGDPTRVEVMVLDGDRGGDRQAQVASVVQ
jgi:hypothetical protein